MKHITLIFLTPLLFLALPIYSQAVDSNLDEDDIRNLIGQLANIEEYQTASMALVKLGIGAIPLLMDELEFNKLGARAHVVLVFQHMRGEARETATQVMIDAVFDENFSAPGWAATTLGYMNRQLVPPMCQIYCRERLVEGNPVQSLQDLGPRKKELVRALAEILEGEEERWVRAGAAIALGNIGDEATAAAPSLIEMLSVGRGWCGSCVYNPDYAVYALRKIGAPVVPFLLEGLKHENPHARSEVCRILEDFSYKPGVIKSLIEALNDEDKYVRWQAAEALEWIGPNAADAIPQLINCLGDEYKNVRRHAALALGRMGPEAEVAVPYLLDALENESSHVRNGIVNALAWIGPKPGVVPALVELLEENDLMLQGTVFYVLGKFGPDSKEAVQPLISLLMDDDERKVRPAIGTLGYIGPAAYPAVPILHAFALSDNDKLASAALRALFLIGDKPEQRLKQLLNFTKSPNIDLKCWVIFLLGKIGSPAKDAIPAIIGFLDDEESQVRVATAKALGNFGVDAASAIPKLKELVAEDERYVREWSEDAIKKIEIRCAYKKQHNENDIHTLILQLADDDWAVCCGAAITLAAMGPDAKEAVLALVGILEAGDEQLRCLAIKALASIGPDAWPAIPTLQVMATLDNSRDVRRAALDAIFIIQGLWPEDDA